LSKEEVLNLFYAYRSKEFYPEIEEHMVTAESVVLLLINKVDTIWSEEAGMDVKLESPIVRWKKLIGDKDPEVAKE
jgi:murein L,D-transpeptidase YafK